MNLPDMTCLLLSCAEAPGYSCSTRALSAPLHQLCVLQVCGNRLKRKRHMRRDLGNTSTDELSVDVEALHFGVPPLAVR
jgi:hypothetical protein